MSEPIPPVTADDERSLELIYALSRHPQRISTFVNGEAAILADRVGRLRIVAEKRSPEPDIRPGGIPPAVDVQWTPKRGQWAFWKGFGRALARSPAAVLGEMRAVARPAAGVTAKRRWAYTAAAAAAYGALLPGWPGRRHVHAHFAATGGMVAHALARTTRAPYSVTVHGAADLFRVNPHLPMLLRDAAFVVAVSEYHRRIILAGIPDLSPDRVIVIHIGVRSADLERASGPVDIGPRSSPARLLSVANLVPMKGMPVLIEATSRLVSAGRDLSLEIIGEGPERPALEAQVARLGLERVVRLRGASAPAEAHAAMRDADLFALASIRTETGAQDGVPTVLMEAMASGTPAVSTRISGIPELIEDGSTGWLAPPGDADALASAMADALDHPEEAARRARAGREHVKRAFDQERNAFALLDAILAAGEPQKASR